MSLDKWTYVEAEDLWMSPRGRSTFAALHRRVKNSNSDSPTELRNGKPDEGQWVVSLIFPPTINFDPIAKVVNEVGKAKFGQSADLINPSKSKVKGLNSPILRADEKVSDVTSKGEPVDLEGWRMIRANSYRKKVPVIRLPDGSVIDDDDIETEAYSGRWMRILVRPSAYDVPQNKGVKFYLEGVQLLRNDDPIGGLKPSDGKAFSAVDDEDADDDEV